jgi:hypothetical protein
MAVTREELEEFQHFADSKLSNGGAESLADLVRQWEARRDYQETVADIKESHEDLAAGRVVPADEAFADVRKKMGAGE